MYKYALIVLLINTYYCGWSVSLHLKSNDVADTTNTLSSSLLSLANMCNHKLISSEIQDKSADCSVPGLEGTKYLKCLIFYDINKQLCNSSLDLKNENLNARLNEKSDIIEFCGSAMSWPVTDLEIDPQYSKMFKRIFSNPHLCTRFCESQDIFVDDVDFYCKYYKWGQDVLAQTQSLNTQISQSENIASVSSVSVHSNIESANDLNNNLTPTTIEKQANNVMKETFSNQEEGNEPISDADSSVKSKANDLPVDPDVAVAQQLGITSPEQLPLKENFSNSISEDHKEVQNLPVDENSLPEFDINSTTPREETVSDKKLPKIHPKLQVINIQPDFGDNGQVSEEIPGNVLSELSMMDDADFDGNLDLGSSKDSFKSMGYKEPNLREVYTSVIQESFTEDNDDHFFSLFLTGVVFVIVLYVLYHNKNKVSKVVMTIVGRGASNHGLPTKMRY